jgi:hypothetical protein
MRGKYPPQDGQNWPASFSPDPRDQSKTDAAHKVRPHLSEHGEFSLPYNYCLAIPRLSWGHTTSTPAATA